MPGFVVRPGGSREYLPREYRGTPQEYYASRIREAARNSKHTSHMKRVDTAGIAKDVFMNNEIARLRARHRELSLNARLFGHSAGISATEKLRIRFAPRI